MYLKDYKGGSNPLLVYLFFALLALLAIIGIGYWIISRRKTQAFLRACKAAQLTQNDINSIKNFCRRFHIKHPLSVVTSQQQFDSFMEQVAHHYKHLQISDTALKQEMHSFHVIRKKLGFSQKISGSRLYSSRQIPIGQTLMVTYSDKATKQQLSFTAKVIDNLEFFLVITPPNDQIDKEVFDQKRAPLHITFTYNRTREHDFDSFFLKKVSQPNAEWQIEHSNHLHCERQQPSLQLPSSLLISQGEVHGQLTKLTNKNCLFTTKENLLEIASGEGILINFEKFSFRAKVDNDQVIDNVSLYQISFTDLQEEDQKLLAQYIHKLKLGNPS